MKKFDIKSLVAGILIGTTGVTTVFAASNITSASISNMNITFNGTSLSLSKPLLSVAMENEQDESVYAPVNELFVNLGYGVNYDVESNTIDLISQSNISHETIENPQLNGTTVLNIANHTDQRNIAESGSFQAEDNQSLVINITSDIKGGTVDLFLFNPDGKEQHITIGSTDLTKEIALEKGTWQYNCSGMFQNGGNIKIVGTIK